MRQLIVIFILFTFNSVVIGQKYQFSSSGTMSQTELSIDTVIKTNLKNVGLRLFIYLDSSYVDTLNIRQFFSKKYDAILQSPFEHFFIANLTNKEMSINKLSRTLIAEEFCQYGQFGFKPVSYFLYPNCGVGLDYKSLILKPSEILIIKGSTKSNYLKANGQKNCFMKLLINENERIVSSLYTKNINSNKFYLNTGLEIFFHNFMRQVAFKQKEP